jgi:hypothetical protein
MRQREIQSGVDPQFCERIGVTVENSVEMGMLEYSVGRI